MEKLSQGTGIIFTIDPRDKPGVSLASLLNPSSPTAPMPLLRSPETGLYPAILAVNTTTHNEATPILYSHNRFRFNPSNTLAPFVAQVGSNLHANLIQHLGMPFPSFDDGGGESQASRREILGSGAHQQGIQ
ncbi:hypothetical protein BCR34DRAFT_593511 [Clohesyomyces aquaticus]|uniref:Uncharacterized protein n=1 Tax=Clohesyomyces aquaticus TaxID=1231657 RepID=A0A1Y1YH78_9PLEO|nr:hypothetical protein BCR34DRAFT_593511 [Clohesyomyces aquaticus]